MTDRKSGLINFGAINSIKDVLDTLKQLNNQLDDLGLDQFKLFNEAYLVVTKSIQQAIVDNYFKNPKFIEKFIVSFAGYYFDAINKTISKHPDLSLPWAKLNTYATKKSSPIFISLMLGANAHINNDLPHVLNQIMQQEKTENLLGDLLKIDKLLMKSGKAIIGLFEEKNKFLDILKRRLQFMYYRPAMYTILYWRIGAWKSYRKLQKDELSTASITNKSVKIANRILYISSVLS